MKINSIEIKTLDPIKTMAFAHLGEYSGIGTAFEKLATWATANNLWATAPRVAGIYHDDPMHTPADKLRSDACVEIKSEIVPAEGMRHYTISGGKYFVMQVEVTMKEYCEAWMKAYQAFKESAYECDMRDHYELYVKWGDCCEDENAVSIVDLCIPMK